MRYLLLVGLLAVLVVGLSVWRKPKDSQGEMASFERALRALKPRKRPGHRAGDEPGERDLGEDPINDDTGR